MNPTIQERIKRIWNCIPVASRVALLAVTQFANTPPYVAPETVFDSVFQVYYGEGWENYRNALRQNIRLRIVTRNFGGETFTGYDALNPFITGIIGCQLLGGCVDGDPNDCPQFTLPPGVVLPLID